MGMAALASPEGRRNRSFEVRPPLARLDTWGLASALNKELGMPIVVVTGDVGTGTDDSAGPKSKYPKGPFTAAAVERNAMQLELFPGYSVKLPQEDAEKNGRHTWVLLVHK